MRLNHLKKIGLAGVALVAAMSVAQAGERPLRCR